MLTIQDAYKLYAQGYIIQVKNGLVTIKKELRETTK